MKWTDLPHGTAMAAEQRLWKAFGDNAGTVAARLKADPGFAEQLAVLATNPTFGNRQCIGLNGEWLHARGIMGKNFFGVEEAIRYFMINPSEAQLANLAKIPWSDKVLNSVKDTHILVATFQFSIDHLDTRPMGGLNNRDLPRMTRIMQVPNEIGWQLVSKTPVKRSEGMPLSKQRTLLEETDEIPTTRLMVYTIIGHFLATGEMLLKNCYVRCSDGFMGYWKGLGVSFGSDGNQESCNDGSLGLASVKKL